MWVWTFGLSLIVGAYSYGSHLVGRFVHPIAYFMFPLSGAFITMDFLPAWARPYMAWNPMMAMFETIRYGQFSNANPRYMFQGYVIAHCVLSLYWGLIALRHVRKHIHVG
jgi:capsular polysaccharide transport system permease protein